MLGNNINYPFITNERVVAALEPLTMQTPCAAHKQHHKISAYIIAIEANLIKKRVRVHTHTRENNKVQFMCKQFHSIIGRIKLFRVRLPSFASVVAFFAVASASQPIYIYIHIIYQPACTKQPSAAAASRSRRRCDAVFKNHPSH